jgi:hypothetical protein
MNKSESIKYTGIEDTLKFLMEEVKAMRQEVIDIKTKTDLKAYSLKEIAQGLGYSPQYLRHRPWKIPNFGKPDEGSNPGKWFYNTIVNWYAIPENDRRSQWESMSSRDRLELLGNPKRQRKTI